MVADKQIKREKVNQLAAELVFSRLAKTKIGERKISGLEKEDLLYELLAGIPGFSSAIVTIIQENIMLFPLSAGKLERKRNEISSLLLESLSLGFLGLHKTNLNNETKMLYQKMQSNRANRYNGEFFVATLEETMAIHEKSVTGNKNVQDYMSLFQSYYYTKSQGVIADQFEELYGETAKLKRDEVIEYLSKIGNVPKSSIRINVLSSKKCIELAKKLLNLNEHDELPPKIYNELNALLSTYLPSLDRTFEDDDGNVLGSEDKTADENYRDIDDHTVTDKLKQQNDDLTDNLLGMMEKVNDQEVKDYIYYQILAINADSDTLDKRFVERVPGNFVRFYENFGEGRENVKTFLVKYWDLQLETVRKKLADIKKVLIRKTDGSLRYHFSKEGKQNS